MLKAFKFKIYPSKEQQVLIEKHIGCARFVYNWGYETRSPIVFSGWVVHLLRLFNLLY
jgi:transposase